MSNLDQIISDLKKIRLAVALNSLCNFQLVNLNDTHIEAPLDLKKLFADKEWQQIFQKALNLYKARTGSIGNWLRNISKHEHFPKEMFWIRDELNTLEWWR